MHVGVAVACGGGGEHGRARRGGRGGGRPPVSQVKFEGKKIKFDDDDQDMNED
jgi:hypothetical protein